jgi:gamma-glutamyltranspeptidase/glutathione hydrolase
MMYGSYRPSGQGIAALQILNILEDFDIKKMGLYSSEYIHLFTEAKKLAFADRAKYYADPKFSDIPVQELISKTTPKKEQKISILRLKRQ